MMNSYPVELAERLEKERVGAFVNGKIEGIQDILDDELIYIHSNGHIDGKKSILELIESGSIKYISISSLIDEIIFVEENSFIISGVLETHAMVKSAEKIVRGRYMAVWRRSGAGEWKLLALQGTATIGVD